MSNMRAMGADFIQMAKEISEHCSKTSFETCDAGECPFSSTLHGCIFEDVRLGSPYEWEFAKEDDHESN